jgi:hypothetical protein
VFIRDINLPEKDGQIERVLADANRAIRVDVVGLNGLQDVTVLPSTAIADVSLSIRLVSEPGRCGL